MFNPWNHSSYLKKTWFFLSDKGGQWAQSWLEQLHTLNFCCWHLRKQHKGFFFCHPMDCSSPGSSVYGILHARILKWVAIPFSRGSSLPRNRSWVSCIACGFFIVWATRDWISFNVMMTIWIWSCQSNIGLAKMRQFCEDKEDNSGR